MPNGRRREALHRARLTTRSVADARPRERRYIVWDEELTGFGVRVSPSGLCSFIVQYRAGEGGRRAASHKTVLGHFPALTPSRARAREVLRRVTERRTNGDGGAPSIPTVRRAFEAHLESRPMVAAKTRSQYRRLLERHAPQWLDLRLDELGRKDVERRFLMLSEDAGPSVANAFVKLLGAVQGLELSVVVKDAARGIAAGVSEVFPRAEQRDDCFHVLYEMNKVRRRLERRAYAAMEREGEALGRLGKIRAHDQARRRKAKRALSRARRECAEAIERFDEFEAAMDTLHGALECVDLASGELHRPEHVEALIEQAARRIESLGVGECAKLAKYLRNRAPGLVLAQKSLLPRLQALAEPWSAQAVSLACICWYLVRALHKRPPPARHRALSAHLLAAYAALQDRLGAASASVLEAVETMLHQRHRASSAIEGFNAALRPYLYVHKGATQGFLELFRAWFNLRTRRWGRLKGTSAHECLTGEPVHDWLTLLGYPPSPTPT